MRRLAIAIPALLFVVSAYAQQGPAVQQGPQMVECRDMATTGNYIASNETVINGKACRPAGTPLLVVDSEPKVKPIPSSASTAPVKPSAATLTEPGMYLTKSSDFMRILGQPITFERTGSRLVSGLTLHIKAAHDNVQLPSRHAQTVTDSSPVFVFIPSQHEVENGVTGGDLVLVSLETHGDRRQIEIAAEGSGRGSQGISITHQVAALRSEVGGSKYEIRPTTPLKRGEYAIYLRRGEGLPAMLYDFTVE
jgi:hypothetical protein